MEISRIGRYEIEKELGRGAMAVVYRAMDPVIGRVVAIKTIRMEHGMGLEQEELHQRLYREAQSAGNLNHPNIITIYDIGEEGDLAYIAMEFVEGETLESWMQKNRIPPFEQTIAIIEQIAAGLDFAAVRGITHRDIKPGNVLMTPDGRAKIADFGIAKISSSTFTQTGMVMGTPSYMSPEQALGNPLDGRSDIFSLGVISYEMLTGERPFSGSSSTTIIYKIVHEDVVPPHKLNVTIHPGLEHIVLRMLEKSPDNRYQTCGEVIQDLHNYTTIGPKTSSKRLDATTVFNTGISKSGNKPILYGLIGVLGILLFVGGYFLLKPSQSNSSATPVQPASAISEGTNTSVVPEGTTASAPPQVVQPSEQAAAPAPETVSTPTVSAKETAVLGKSGQAQIQVGYDSATYNAAIYDGSRLLANIDGASKAIPIPSGDHHFRIASDEVYLNSSLGAMKLKAGETRSITLPGLGSAYIEVPDQAYDGCEIFLNGKRLPPPYPAQIQRLAAGSHKIVFKWSSGDYEGKDLASSFSIQEDRHYGILGDPDNEKVEVKPIR
jgi:serine/threonine protein kinase